MIKQLILLTLLLLTYAGGNNAIAQHSCQSGELITQQFDNGAQWSICWESRIRENLVLSDIYYTPPDGKPSLVLSDARLSQLHVAYDDSDVTYNDITQYGLGGGYLVDLTPEDCPLGELLLSQTRPSACKWLANGDDNFRMRNRASSAHSLNIFSVSQVGSYAYIISWLFYDDGAIEPQIGASGALQRSSASLTLPFGRVLQGDPDTLWLSHTHNYYWHLDFDLGDSATDDVVAESRFVFNKDGIRQPQSTVLTTEAALQIDPASATAWHILDNPAKGESIFKSRGYIIEPTRFGHRLVREQTEPYTEFDFFVTLAKDCERFASQNSRFNPDCLNNVLEYVDNESLIDQDLVVWHRVSFHHVPRSEDQRHMHSHWDGFLIEPTNVHTSSPGLKGQPNQAPQLDNIGGQTNRRGDSVAWHAHANDADNDPLTFTATGLPPGITVSADGTFSGRATSQGDFSVTVSVNDGITSAERTFDWQITKKKSGLGFIGYWVFVLMPFVIHRRLLIYIKTMQK